MNDHLAARRVRSFPTLEIEESEWAQGAEIIAGVDEAGRGPLAGPVVAGAVVLPRGVTIDGVNDSKKLSAKQRERLYHEIHAVALSIGVGIVSHEVIDRINIYQASILAMHKAIENGRLVPDLILADGNSFRHETVRYRNVIGGDAKSQTIAAASIIAKVTRDRLMMEYHAQYPEYGFDRHKGYGTRIHVEAVQRFGLCPIHRRTFHVPIAELEHSAGGPD
ncbi:MAG TPA: ribonuclease HII [Bacteroidota bacterium]|nr:ribonuclease HII [Bacteroidota bacterium]